MAASLARAGRELLRAAGARGAAAGRLRAGLAAQAGGDLVRGAPPPPPSPAPRTAPRPPPAPRAPRPSPRPNPRPLII